MAAAGGGGMAELGRAGGPDSRSAGASAGRGSGACPELGAEAVAVDSPETRAWKPVRLAQERGCACGCGGGAGGQGPGRARRGCGSAPEEEAMAGAVPHRRRAAAPWGKGCEREGFSSRGVGVAEASELDAY